MSEIFKRCAKQKDCLKLAFKLCQLVATAGYCTSKNEMDFSSLKIIKNWLRTTLGDERLESLMLMHIEKDLTDSMDFTNAVQSWVNLKTRRLIL